jgi:DNA-binding MarR family transcriptional regulator
MKVQEIDDMLGAPARLAIIATAAGGERWTFTALGRETGLADGNLHVQTRKLAEAGYLAREKERQGGRMVTCFELTERGRQAFRNHLRRLDRAQGGDGRFSRGDFSEKGGRGQDKSQVW